MPSNIDHFECVKTLGSGISAKVKLAKDKNNNDQLVALKVFDKSNTINNTQAMKTLKEEVAAYSSLSHSNMVSLISFKEDAIWKKSDGRTVKIAYMVLEFVSGGELFDFVALSAFSESICRFYFKQMLQVIHHAHSKGVAHRDLKPENIMLDKEFNVKVADFGFAAPTQGRDGSGFLNTRLGTVAYMSPELVEAGHYQGHVVDIFALGIILFIMYSGHPPFNSASPADTHYKLLVTNRADLFWKHHENAHTDPERSGPFFSDDFKDLITNMLQYQPNQRLGMADIIGHPWMDSTKSFASVSEVQTEFSKR